MKQVTIDLRKMARGTLCRGDGRKCITGHILQRLFDVSDEALSGYSYPANAHGEAVVKWARKYVAQLDKLIMINDRNHDSWETKKELMRPIIKEMGIAPRFIR